MKEREVIRWTEDLESLRYHTTFVFITTLSNKMHELGLNQRGLAERLGISESRVSQIFNNPGNLTLSKMIKWAHAVELKIAVVPYNDEDPNFKKAPVIADAFTKLWELHGRPRTFEEIQSIYLNCERCEYLNHDWEETVTVESIPWSGEVFKPPVSPSLPIERQTKRKVFEWSKTSTKLQSEKIAA
ncbi:helix-turn-helix transcriptional regulator [bacterium]|nr:helix-turn-helix transcriptional regulator [bacterium]